MEARPGRKRATRLLWLGLIAAGLGLPGCGPVNTPATHTGGYEAGSPIIDIGTCCVTYDAEAELNRVYTADDPKATTWLPVVRPDGRPHPAGHRDDAYYTGPRAHRRGTRVPAGYHYTPPPSREGGALHISLARRWPQLKRVRFGVFDSFASGKLTKRGQRQVESWIKARYGDVHIARLGEGGFSVVYKVCPDPRTCKVVKIRKMPPVFAEWKRIDQATRAAEELKRDLAIFEVADIMTRGALYLGPDGKPAPFLIAGVAVPPPADRPPDDPPGRLATVARPTSAELLVIGVVEQELVAFRPTGPLRAMMAAAAPRNSAARLDALAHLPPGGRLKPRHVHYFFDRYTRLSKLGPEVHKVQRLVRDCGRMARLPSVARYCLAVRRTFQIPDDFLDRVLALEQMYRDTAAEVMRFSRANFGRALGNRGADGEVREVGLDYNHGRNAGWDPRRRQFVLFDC